MKSLDLIAQEGALSLGLVFPLEAYAGSVPNMDNQEALAQQAEAAGFKALWFRDVPFHDPTFGDAGQMYDPWIYMTHIMNHTKSIALATGSVILPLRHPVHTLKSINSLQHLSNGRIIVGVASGDRPLEYPAFDKDRNNRSALFRDNFNYLKAMQGDFPSHKSAYHGQLNGHLDILPKTKWSTPFIVTGHSGQSLDWIAQNANGWLYYPRGDYLLQVNMEEWDSALKRNNQPWKPYMQSLYIDLEIDRKIEASRIHLGFRANPDYLVSYLSHIKKSGVNHVILNLKFNQMPIDKTIAYLGKEVLPIFHSK